MTLDLTFSVLVDDSLTLRIPRIEDASALFRLVDRNRAHLRRFLGWLDSNQSEADSLAFIEREHTRIKRQEAFTLAIWHNESIVGLVGLHDIDQLNRSASVGYWLGEAFQGKGIMTRSVDALVNHGFKSMALHRIEIECAVENKRSQQIPLALGFKKEGTLKETIWHYGAYFDAHVYGLIAPKKSDK